MARTHYVGDEQVHYTWDTANEPILTITSGDTIVVTTRDVSDNQVVPGVDAQMLVDLDLDREYPLCGPIAIEGASAGDTLRVDILDLHTMGWGWTGITPGYGLLTDEFVDPYLRIFDLSRGDVAPFRDDIFLPLEPFFGTMGVCPRGARAQHVMPPGTFGGNMDIRQLVRGSTLYLPVEVDGALFSCGDAHAAQGDGEVCVTGLEAPMIGALRLSIDRERGISRPEFRTPAPLTRRVDSGTFYATTGVSSDLYAAAQDAVRGMIDYLGCVYDLSRADAYVLCSLVVDLKISEIVDGGQYIVSAFLPETIFASPNAKHS